MLKTWAMSENKMRGGKEYDFESINRTMEQRELFYVKDFNRQLLKIQETGQANILSTLISDLNFADPTFERLLGEFDLLPNGSTVKFEQIKGMEQENIFMGTTKYINEIIKGGCK